MHKTEFLVSFIIFKFLNEHQKLAKVLGFQVKSGYGEAESIVKAEYSKAEAGSQKNIKWSLSKINLFSTFCKLFWPISTNKSFSRKQKSY